MTAQQLNQSPQSMSIQEGEDVSMNCNSSSMLNFLQWYKEDAWEGLILLIKLLKGGELARNGKLTVQFGGTKKDSLLNISASEPKDAGTYFCAGSTVLPEHPQPALKAVDTPGTVLSRLLNSWHEMRLCPRPLAPGPCPSASANSCNQGFTFPRLCSA